MATEQNTDLAMERERADVALFATWELEAICEALIAESQSLEPAHLAMRGLSIRARDLASIVMSAIDDRSEPTSSLRRRLTGERSPMADHEEAAQ